MCVCVCVCVHSVKVDERKCREGYPSQDFLSPRKIVIMLFFFLFFCSCLNVLYEIYIFSIYDNKLIKLSGNLVQALPNIAYHWNMQPTINGCLVVAVHSIPLHQVRLILDIKETFQNGLSKIL